MSAERQLNPSEFSTEQLDRFLFALVGRFKMFYRDGVEKPMTKTQLAEYLDYSESGIDKLVKAGVIKAYRLQDGGDPRFLASEVLERLKRK